MRYGRKESCHPFPFRASPARSGEREGEARPLGLSRYTSCLPPSSLAPFASPWPAPEARAPCEKTPGYGYSGLTVKGQPDSEEMVPLWVLKESTVNAAYAYIRKHPGPKEKISNKGGSLSNRLRAVLG